MIAQIKVNELEGDMAYDPLPIELKKHSLKFIARLFNQNQLEIVTPIFT